MAETPVDKLYLFLLTAKSHAKIIARRSQFVNTVDTDSFVSYNRVMETYAAREFRRALADRETTATAVAKALGISKSYLSLLVNGKRRMTRKYAQRLHLMVGMPADTWNTQKDTHEHDKTL